MPEAVPVQASVMTHFGRATIAQSSVTPRRGGMTTHRGWVSRAPAGAPRNSIRCDLNRGKKVGLLNRGRRRIPHAEDAGACVAHPESWTAYELATAAALS